MSNFSQFVSSIFGLIDSQKITPSLVWAVAVTLTFIMLMLLRQFFSWLVKSDKIDKATSQMAKTLDRLESKIEKIQEIVESQKHSDDIAKTVLKTKPSQLMSGPRATREPSSKSPSNSESIH